MDNLEKDIQTIYDELAELFYEATGQDAEEWKDDPESWSNTIDTPKKYLIMMLQVEKILSSVQGK